MPRSRTIVLSWTIALLSCTHSVHAAGPASATLAARLQSAEEHSSLDDAALRPWHLKLAVHLFDPQGTPSGDGTIEEWWSSPGHDRREYNTPTYKATEIRDGDKQYRTKDAGSPPYELSLLLEQVVDPTAEYKKEDPSHAELRKLKFGTVPLECIMLSQPIHDLASAPLGLFPTYCFDVGKDVLRASYEFGNQSILMNRMGVFLGKNVATKVTLSENERPVADEEVTVLRTIGPEEPRPEFNPSDDMAAQNLKIVPVSGDTMEGKVLSKVPPIYPKYAEQNRIRGTVILNAIIGTDGHIHSLRVISAPDPSLAISAVDAVRRWTYTPYLWNGLPVDVDTTITVNYSFHI